MEEFSTKDELLEWLRALGKVTILSASLITSTAALHSNMLMTPRSFENVIEYHQMDIGPGPYRIETTTSSATDKPEIELSLTNMIVAIWADARLADSGTPVGGFRALTKELSTYDYVARHNYEDRTHTGRFMIPIPPDPTALKELVGIMKKHAMVWAIDDGSGTLHQGNIFIGRGIQPT